MVCVGSALGGAASAAVTVAPSDPGLLHYTSPIDGDGRSIGSDMAGMTVRVAFGDGTTHTGVWGATGALGGAAGVAGRFSLAVSGNTWDNAWTFSNLSGETVHSIVVDAGAGNAVFDLDFGNANGTAGSFSGRTFIMDVMPSFDVTATFRNAVALNGASPVGDLFTVLDLAFTGEIGLAAETSFNFRVDTDNAPNGLTASVAEPGAAAALGLGVLALAGLRRRR